MRWLATADDTAAARTVARNPGRRAPDRSEIGGTRPRSSVFYKEREALGWAGWGERPNALELLATHHLEPHTLRSAWRGGAEVRTRQPKNAFLNPPALVVKRDLHLQTATKHYARQGL